MDPRVFLLICLAAASRHQPSPALEVEANDPQDHAYNETDFQELKGAVNSGVQKRMSRIARAPMWPSFLKAHPKEGWGLFQKLAADKNSDVRQAAAVSPAWPMLLQTHNAEAWRLFQKLATEDFFLLAINVREAAAVSPAWPMLLETHNAEAWQLFQKLAEDVISGVRGAAATSPAWPMLLETHNAEAWQLFQKLAKDKSEYARKAAPLSPAWPMLLETHTAAAWQLFQKLAKDKNVDVRGAAAISPAWPMLLETHNAEAWHLFQKLAKDEYVVVRKAAAISPAWPMLLETHHAEARRLFENLTKNEDWGVREKAVVSPAWPNLVKSNPWERWEVFAELMSSRELLHHGSLAELAESPAWKAFGNVPLTDVAEHLNSFTPTNLHEMAMSAQKVADNGFRHKVKDLPVVKGVATTLQRSSNETWLGEMAELPLFARNAAQRLIELAIKAKEEAEAATAKVMILLVIVLLLAVLCIVLFLLWYYYPTIRQWQDEKKLAEEAKQAIRAAEVFEMVISVTPEPPAHMAIFDNYQRIYANPYILYKYGYLKEALTQAFRISAEALDVGLHEWDFSAVQKNSTNAVQDMASKSYGMARTFIDNNQAADLQVLMQLCDQIQNDCSPFLAETDNLLSNTLPASKDHQRYTSKIEEADMTAVDKCFSMYEQAFLAKRAYFDPLLECIGGKTGAEANLCGEKGILRLAEKNCLRPSGGLIWDCVRAMCVGHDVSELIEVMKCLKDEHDAKRLRIIHVNNRFKRPTSDNWQDIAVYVMFTDPRFSDVVAEIQLTHETFVAVRTKFRAHDAYDHIRFAAEALKLRDKVIVRGVPDSVTKRPEQ